MEKEYEPLSQTTGISVSVSAVLYNPSDFLPIPSGTQCKMQFRGW